jgi:hypothetical protein
MDYCNLIATNYQQQWADCKQLNMLIAGGLLLIYFPGKEEIVRLPFLISITWSGSTGLISA